MEKKCGAYWMEIAQEKSVWSRMWTVEVACLQWHKMLNMMMMMMMVFKHMY